MKELCFESHIKTRGLQIARPPNQHKGSALSRISNQLTRPANKRAPGCHGPDESHDINDPLC